jgi:esterase/lipase superfamily enzyme
VVVRREHVKLWSPAIGADGDLVAYGHHGRPVLAFPSESGPAWQFEERGMVDAVAGLVDAGRVKLYCVGSFDAESWSNPSVPMEERARNHERYEDWVVHQVVPWIAADCGGPQEIVTAGCSLGAFHAANFCLRRADVFPVALCFSGVYDMDDGDGSWRADTFYFNNPMDYVANAGGDHLDWLRRRVSLLLVCGQGQWEDTTGALESTRRFGALLAEKGIRHEVDLWGYDVPHDWPSWRAQLAHHLPRFV